METINNYQVEDDEIDLLELLYTLLHRWWLILLCFFIGAGAAGAYTELLVTPLYKTSASLYVLTKTTSVTSLADLQIGTQLTSDFQIIATSRPVVNDAITEVENQTGFTYTYDQFIDYVTVSNETDTRILKITVTHPDPEMAAVIANALAESTADHMSIIMDTSRPTTVEDAIVPKEPSSPSLTKNVAIGGLGAALIVCVILVIRFMIDDIIHNEEDVRKYLGIDTIAVFPVDNKAEADERKFQKEYKKKKRRKK